MTNWTPEQSLAHRRSQRASDEYWRAEGEAWGESPEYVAWRAKRGGRHMAQGKREEEELHAIFLRHSATRVPYPGLEKQYPNEKGKPCIWCGGPHPDRECPEELRRLVKNADIMEKLKERGIVESYIDDRGVPRIRRIVEESVFKWALIHLQEEESK
jgi:hypothetical protein